MSAIKLLGINKVISYDINISSKQKQTEAAFSFKWAKRNTYESEAVTKAATKWLFERYSNGDPKELDCLLNENNTKKIILDIGCGSGYSSLAYFGNRLNDHFYLGIDISDAVSVAASRFKEQGVKGEFIKSDLFKLDFIPDFSVDIIFSEGVLHHTDSVHEAIKYLVTKLKVGGLFMFYVYNKKADIREFTDDYIRQKISSLSDEQAWEKLKPLTNLGVQLGKLNIEINVEEDIDLLGIKKGKLDIQRFFYWNICKLFYRPDYNLDEMNHINFDWFRPLNCHRHTPDEIKNWCYESNLDIEHINIQEAGITIVARKLK
ncbi:class I SAM-dependent methyltransferase [Candidatus Woesearchaeota archaeon]|nr:class I SAM-dependent methyltransferase [Candidatus Woesearchaeota archaeon]